MSLETFNSRTIPVKCIKPGEYFKPVGSAYSRFSDVPSYVTGVKVHLRSPVDSIRIQCRNSDGLVYLMHDYEEVVRWL